MSPEGLEGEGTGCANIKRTYFELLKRMTSRELHDWCCDKLSLTMLNNLLVVSIHFTTFIARSAIHRPFENNSR